VKKSCAILPRANLGYEAMSIKLWHCYGSRSVRPLWALEEMGLEYEITSMQFPPRFKEEGYLQLNSLGTVPYFTDGDVTMTESSGICLYLVEKYGKWDFGVRPHEAGYGAYINWLFHSDATLTFPQTVFLRFARFEVDRGLQEAGYAYRNWFQKRLIRLEQHLEGREYLAGDKFTIADIAVGYAIYLAEFLHILGDEAPHVRAYWQRLSERPAFKKALQTGEEYRAF